MMVGPQLWSAAVGQTSTSCRDTICINCSVSMLSTSITNSLAQSQTSGKNMLPPSSISACFWRVPHMTHASFCNVMHRRFTWSVCKIISLYMQNTLPLTSGPQVYGGGVTFVVQPYLWSSSSSYGDASTSAGDTIASGLLAVFIDCNFSGSRSSSHTTTS